MTAKAEEVISIRLDKALLAQIDQQAESEDRTRVAQIRVLLRTGLQISSAGAHGTQGESGTRGQTPHAAPLGETRTAENTAPAIREKLPAAGAKVKISREVQEVDASIPGLPPEPAHDPRCPCAVCKERKR